MDKQTDNKHDLIIACIGNNELDENILDIAYKESRMANCKWRVLHIDERKNPHRLDSRIQRMVKKASNLRAEIINSQNPTIAEGIIEYAQTLDSTKQKIVFLVGTSKHGGLKKYFHNLYHQVKPSLTKLGISVRSVHQERKYNRNYTFIAPIFNFSGLPGLLESVIAVLFGFLGCFITQQFLPKPDSSLSTYFIYLIACIVASVRGGIIPGMIAAVLSLLSINFFFLKTEHSLQIGNTTDLSNLLFFFITAISASLICSGTRRYIIDSQRKEAYLNAMLNVSETLNRPLQETEALAYIHHELEKLFGSKIAFFTPALIDHYRLDPAYPAAPPEFTDDDIKALGICHSEYRSTGNLTTTLPQAKWYFEPMMSPGGFQGVLAIKLSESPLRHDSNVIGILLSIADLSAIIIERIEHTVVSEQNRVNEEKEKLRTMLLSSVSHDLKTPLASIIGSLDVFHNLNDKLAPEVKTALTQTAWQEARRLDSFITNILDMAKLESSSATLNKEWHRPKKLIELALGNAIANLGSRTTKHEATDNYEVEIDYNMMLRALGHLFDNISRYTPDDSRLSISYGPDKNGIFTILIKDSGPGIAEDMLEAIFDKYTRIRMKDSIIAGTGLGLPISRSIIESHGGNIIAFNNTKGKGTTFKITLPNYRRILVGV